MCVYVQKWLKEGEEKYVCVCVCDSTIGKGEVEVKLLVSKQLVGGWVHGEEPERRVAPAIRSD